MADSCGADTLANTLLTSLTAGENFDVPEVDLSGSEYTIPDLTGDMFAPLPTLTNENLTTRNVGGTGTFDALMQSVYNHLKKEFEANRITGQEYTKAYIELTSAALGGAVQYLLGKDQAYWQAVLIQQQAKLAQVEIIKAKVDLATAKVMLQTARIQALTAEATFGLTKMKISTEDATYCSVLAQTDQVRYTTTDILPKQKALLMEQIEVQRAQTLDTRTDGVTIVGSVGKQKDLYSQQITSYQRDAEVKAAKMFTDAWITQKTLDEGLLPPDGFTNDSIDTILAKLKINNDLN